jgi:hypothetical protein
MYGTLCMLKLVSTLVCVICWLLEFKPSPSPLTGSLVTMPGVV